MHVGRPTWRRSRRWTRSSPPGEAIRPRRRKGSAGRHGEPWLASQRVGRHAARLLRPDGRPARTAEDARPIRSTQATGLRRAAAGRGRLADRHPPRRVGVSAPGKVPEPRTPGRRARTSTAPPAASSSTPGQGAPLCHLPDGPPLGMGSQRRGAAAPHPSSGERSSEHTRPRRLPPLERRPAAIGRPCEHPPPARPAPAERLHMIGVRTPEAPEPTFRPGPNLRSAR